MYLGLYDLVVQIIGPLPLEWQFIYYIFVCLLGLLMLYVIFSPVLLMYELLGVRK